MYCMYVYTKVLHKCCVFSNTNQIKKNKQNKINNDSRCGRYLKPMVDILQTPIKQHNYFALHNGQVIENSHRNRLVVVQDGDGCNKKYACMQIGTRRWDAWVIRAPNLCGSKSSRAYNTHAIECQCTCQRCRRCDTFVRFATALPSSANLCQLRRSGLDLILRHLKIYAVLCYGR